MGNQLQLLHSGLNHRDFHYNLKFQLHQFHYSYSLNLYIFLSVYIGVFVWASSQFANQNEL